MNTVYLAGPIEGVSLEQGKTWRDEAAVLFNSQKVLVCDPNRMWVLSPDMHSKCTEEQLGAIASIDLHAVQTVDGLLVLMDNHTYTCGTFIEIVEAISIRKPIVFWTPDNTIPGFLKGVIYNTHDSYIGIESDLLVACELLMNVIGAI